MGAHGLLADEQGLGDPPVGEAPARSSSTYLTFALREAGRGQGARSARAQRERRRGRGGSTDTAAPATARSGAPGQLTAVPYEGLAGLPALNPDHDGERVPEAVADLRPEIAAADAVPFCPPEYAGSLPRSLKNLLDWTVAAVRFTASPWPGSAWPPRAAGWVPTMPSPAC
jgi:hypothetical protein